MARLEVDIDANIDGLRNSISQAAKEATKLGNPFQKTSGIINTLSQRASILRKNLESATDVKSIAAYNRRLQETQNELQRVRGLGIPNTFNSSLNNASRSVNGLTRATSGYNSIGIEFSRIIQDAPFGIIGIGNNIQQLAGNFQQLRATSTSTGAALKTAFASIISPANLLVLGISVLTSALTFLSMKGFFRSKKSAEDAAEALEKYRQSLDAVKRSAIEGQASAQKEIQTFQLLKAQAENANVPLNKRIEAVRDLQKEFPEYLGNLSQEQILSGDVGDSYVILTNALIATAKARAFSDKIAENSLKLLTLETKKADTEVNKLTDSQIEAIKETSGLQTGVAGIGNALGKQTAARSKNLEIDKEILGITDEIKAINKENESLQENINKQIALGANFTTTQLEETKKLKRVYEDINTLPRINPLERFDQMSQGFEAPLDNLSSGKAETQGIIIPPPNTDLFIAGMNTLRDQFKAYGGSFLSVATQFVENLNMTIRNGLANAFEGIGQSLGEAIARGENVFSAVGKSLLNSIGGFLGDLGKQLIAVGVAGLAFTTLLETIKKGGPAAIPAAIGAIAAGTALVALAGAFRATAGKGVGGGSSGGGAGSSGIGSQNYGGTGETFNPFENFGNNLEFRVEGTTMLAVLKNTNKQNQRG